MFVFAPYSERHPLDNTLKIGMLGQQNGRLQIPSKGVGYAGLLPEVSHQARDAEPSAGDLEERPAGHTGRLTSVRHEDVPDRQGLVSPRLRTPRNPRSLHLPPRRGGGFVAPPERHPSLTRRRPPGQQTLAWLYFTGGEASPALL